MDDEEYLELVDKAKHGRLLPGGEDMERLRVEAIARSNAEYAEIAEEEN